MAVRVYSGRPRADVLTRCGHRIALTYVVMPCSGRYWLVKD